MLHPINDLPAHVIGFRATAHVNKTDYENVLIPAIKKIDKEHGHIHFIMVLETPVSNFTIAAWMQDALLTLKHYRGWKKIAIVTNEKGVEKFTNMVSAFIPGQTKGFTLSQLEEAKQWVAKE